MDGGEALNYNKTIVVANTRDDTLTFIDNWMDKKIENLKIKDLDSFNSKQLRGNFQSCNIGPYDLATDGKNYLYCTNVYDNSIVKVDLRTRKVLDIAPVGKYPACIRYYKSNLYIVNSDSNSVSVVEESSFSLLENIPVGEKPIDIQVDEKNDKLYIANGNGFSIDVIDLNGKRKERIKLVDNPVKLVIDDGIMYILSNVNNGLLNNSNIYVMDLETYSIKTMDNLKGIFSNMIKINGGEVIFITSMDNGYLYRMEMKEKNLLSKIYLGGMPNKLEWDGDNILFISNILTDIITVFDIKENKPIDSIKVGKEPNGILVVDRNYVVSN